MVEADHVHVEDPGRPTRHRTQAAEVHAARRLYDFLNEGGERLRLRRGWPGLEGRVAHGGEGHVGHNEARGGRFCRWFGQLQLYSADDGGVALARDRGTVRGPDVPRGQ